MDNAVDGIIMLNLMDNVLDNKFKKINQTDPYYAQRLQEHAREKEINKNLKDMIMNLSYSMREPNENTLVLTNKLKETLNQPIKLQNQETGVPTGGAANINKNKLKKLKNLFKNLNWEKLDDLILAYIYTIYDNRPNSKEKVQKLKIQICNELKIPFNNSLFLYYENNKLNFSQKIFNIGSYNAIINALTIGILWIKTNDLLEKFYSRPDINITDKELNIKNDMRHITGLAFLTVLYGAEQARKYGYLKEHLDFFTHEDKLDSLIDFENNEKGINIALKYPNLSMYEIIEKIYEIYIKPYR